MDKKILDQQKEKAFQHWQRSPGDVTMEILSWLYGPSKNTISSYISKKIKSKTISHE